MTDRRRAYRIVDAFEQALCEYTEAPYCVATDCCTSALFMCLAWVSGDHVRLPKHNYIGVYQACLNTGYEVEWTDEEWRGSYLLEPTPIVDSAKYFERGMYRTGTLTCLSFGASKRLNIGRGGAILTDRKDAVGWIRPRTMDGRTPGEDYSEPSFVQPAWRCNMTPELAARGLDLLTYVDDGPDDDWRAYPDLSVASWSLA